MVETLTLLYGIGILVGSYIAAEILILILNIIKKLASKTKTNLDDEIIDAVKKPLRVAGLITGLFIGAYHLWPDFTIAEGVTILTAYWIVLILLIAYVVGRIVGSIFKWYAKEVSARRGQDHEDALFRFMRRFSAGIVYVLAILLILDRVGVEIGPLLAGLGIAGLAVALALQETLSNLFSGIFIATDKQIQLGDFIELESGLKGTVVDITWRTTRIRTLPNNYVILPNTKIANQTLTNYHIGDREMGIIIPVGVAYGSDLDKVEKVTIDTARKIQKTVEGAVKDFEPFIRYNEYADSSINFSVILRVQEFVNQYLVKHEFMKALKKAYDKNRIEIPFPQRDVWMKK